MRPVLAELVELLTLEQVASNRFRGNSLDLGWGAIFGGQVLAQGLMAAARTVDQPRPAHSLHAYFLRAGDVGRPIDYEVERSRDGHSFCTRRVQALQDNEPLFTLMAGFHRDEPGFEHAEPMPQVPGPEGLASEQELARSLGERLPPKLRAAATAERAVETRPVELRDPLRPEVRPPARHHWLRAVDPLPHEPLLHQAILAWASDFSFLGTSLDPHGVSWLSPGLQIASLDHAMWFHRAFAIDDWLLYAVESPSASGARGWVRGRVFDRSGRLVASTAQEGLIRMRAAKAHG
jgi:acyl-CoA thioesterase-2